MGKTIEQLRAEADRYKAVADQRKRYEAEAAEKRKLQEYINSQKYGDLKRVFASVGSNVKKSGLKLNPKFFG
jgi:hypothetical protein